MSRLIRLLKLEQSVRVISGLKLFDAGLKCCSGSWFVVRVSWPGREESERNAEHDSADFRGREHYLADFRTIKSRSGKNRAARVASGKSDGQGSVTSVVLPDE